ncbi:MAG: 50S ribosomal protein L4 [Patescibacteria group bacterium]
MNAPLYNQEGKDLGKLELPDKIFGLPWNADLVHQVVVSQQGNARTPVAHAKGRGEVRGGGKKPWKQKGTGRARHGSIRSPLWVGGGVTHGPTKEKIYARKINKKMAAKAWATIVSQKLRDGEVFFIDKLTLSGIKTKSASSIISNLSKKLDKKELVYKKGNRALIALGKRDNVVEKSFRNLPAVKMIECRNMNALVAMTYKFIFFVDYK